MAFSTSSKKSAASSVMAFPQAVGALALAGARVTSPSFCALAILDDDPQPESVAERENINRSVKESVLFMLQL